MADEKAIYRVISRCRDSSLRMASLIDEELEDWIESWERARRGVWAVAMVEVGAQQLVVREMVKYMCYRDMEVGELSTTRKMQMGENMMAV